MARFFQPREGRQDPRPAGPTKARFVFNTGAQFTIVDIILIESIGYTPGR